MAITLKQIKAARDAPPTSDEEITRRHRERVGAARLQREADKGKPAHFDDWEFVFSSGRRVSGEIFSISADIKEITYGYDGSVNWPPSDWNDERDKDADLTADDMRELADMMIDRWTKFRDGL